MGSGFWGLGTRYRGLGAVRSIQYPVTSNQHPASSIQLARP